MKKYFNYHSVPISLYFSRKYYEKLRSEAKKITIRMVSKRLPKPGDLVYIVCGGLILGIARVTSVVIKSLGSLGNYEVKEEGFNSLEELLEAIKGHYPGIKEDTLVVVIRFEWEKKFDPPVSETEYFRGTKYTPKQIAKIALENLNLSEMEREVLIALSEEGSIRAAAKRLGGLEKRDSVRRILKRAVKQLKEKEII
ncbi:MAG TPA: ASCH domain-containing protein [Thermofilum sp.]|nr:ASCH domain-containing protein [Thermofilum sp.]